MQFISVFVIVIYFCVVVYGINSYTLDTETPQWKIDMNRMVLQSNDILTPSSDKTYYENHHGKNNDRNFDRIAPRYRYRNNKREHYYPKPVHKNHRNKIHQQRPNSQVNELGHLLNPKEYPPNWNGGYYKYHQEGHAVVPHVGANVNVPITKGNFQAQRNKIITTVIKPDDEWKYAHILHKSSSESSPLKQSHFHQTDPTHLRNHRRKHKKHCVVCPEERTLITNKKRDKVLFEAPKLKSCRGRILNSKYTFKSNYGPKPGDLLPPGTHALVGEIHYLNKPLQLCHLRVNVITKQCEKFDIPPGLKMNCDAGNNWGSECQFQCNSPGHVIDGDNRMFCNDDLKWIGNVPNCKKKTNSCEIPIFNDLNVKILCNATDYNSDTLDNNAEEATKLPQGTQCRVECDRAYRSIPRSSSAVCILGEWHGNLSVSCKRYRRKAQRSRSMKRRKIPFLHSDGIS